MDIETPKRTLFIAAKAFAELAEVSLRDGERAEIVLGSFMSDMACFVDSMVKQSLMDREKYELSLNTFYLSATGNTDLATLLLEEAKKGVPIPLEKRKDIIVGLAKLRETTKKDG